MDIRYHYVMQRDQAWLTVCYVKLQNETTNVNTKICPNKHITAADMLLLPCILFTNV